MAIMRFARFVVCTLSCLLLALLCWLAYEAAVTVRAARNGTGPLAEKIATQAGEAIAKRADPAIENLTRATGKAADLIESVSKDYYDPRYPQAGFYQLIKTDLETSAAVSRSTFESVEKFNALLDATNQNLNGDYGLLPKASSAVDTTTDSVQSTMRSLDASMETLTADTHAALVEVPPVIKGLAQNTQDAHELMQEAKPGVTAMSGAAQDVEKVTDLAAERLTQLMKPTSLAKRAAMFVWKRFIDMRTIFD